MWGWQDAWILQAVVYAGRRGDLRSVLAHADAIDVDVPSREQIEQSVCRLMAVGLVRPEGTRVYRTRAGKRLVRQSGWWRDGIRTVTPHLLTQLRTQVAFPDHVGAWTLSQSEWQAAYDRYRAH